MSHFIGQGKHGCLFSPPFQPTEGSFVPVPDVAPSLVSEASLGKIFTSETYFKKELELAERVASIDPRQHWFIYPVASSTATLSAVAHLTSDECNALNSLLKKKTKRSADVPIYQLVMPFGGKTVLELCEKAVASRTKLPASWALNVVHKCLLGVQHLLEAGFVHQDIKADNIVIDESGNAKLIDFGLMVERAVCFDKSKNGYLKSGYYLHPPEYRTGRTSSAIEQAKLENYISCDDTTDMWTLYLRFMPKHAQEQALTASFEAATPDDISTRYTPDAYAIGLLMLDMSPAVHVNAQYSELCSSLIHPNPFERAGITRALQLSRA